jgi:hypothetical protein
LLVYYFKIIIILDRKIVQDENRLCLINLLKIVSIKLWFCHHRYCPENEPDKYWSI